MAEVGVNGAWREAERKSAQMTWHVIGGKHRRRSEMTEMDGVAAGIKEASEEL